ncbi:MAG: ABC transporter permease [Lachnospiraceae bacterium]|nr:ABC transporter permease [Lachnospiraceae bacterium]MDO4733848.1 ABC transporter permease [Lachnospiraceae bacterium]
MKYVIKKIITLIVALLLISFIVFLAFSVLPGDAALAKLGQNATPERIAALREQMGLDKPVLIRYFLWLGNAFRGNFGESLQYTGVSVNSLIAARLGNSALLSLISFIMVIVFSIPIGIFSAKRKSTVGKVAMSTVTQFTMGIPSFFLGVIITYIFSLALRWFVIGQYTQPSTNLPKAIAYLVFPAIAISLPKIAMTVKFLATSIRSELHKDYVRTAYAKGCTRNGVLYRHALKNSMVPVITFLGVIVAEIVAGSIVVEQVFSVPGIGTLLLTAIANRDFPVVEAVVLLIAFFIIVINFAVDMIYMAVDPRVKL